MKIIVEFQNKNGMDEQVQALLNALENLLDKKEDEKEKMDRTGKNRI